MADKPAGPSKPAAEPAPGAGAPSGKKKSNRKWLYIAGAVLVVALLVIITKSKGATAEPAAAVGAPEGTLSPIGGAGSAGEGGSTAKAETPGAPPVLAPGGPLRPGEKREREETTSGGSIRFNEEGGAQETPGGAGAAAAPAGPAAEAAAPAPGVKWSRNPAVRKEQQAAIAKGEDPNKVNPHPAGKRETSKAKKKPGKPKAKKAAAHKKAPAHKAPAHKKAPAKKPASHKPPPHHAPARKAAARKTAKRRR